MNLEVLCKTAHDDRIKVGMLDTDVKNETLRRAADKILSHEEEILAANAVDVTNGKERNMPAGLLDRLTLNHDRLEGMADGLRQIAKLDDPIGEVLGMKKDPKNQAVLAEVSGVVTGITPHADGTDVTVGNTIHRITLNEERKQKPLRVKVGDKVQKGDFLTLGSAEDIRNGVTNLTSANPHDIVKYKDNPREATDAVQDYLATSMQYAINASLGDADRDAVDRRHVELTVSKLTENVKITDSSVAPYVEGDIIKSTAVEKWNKQYANPFTPMQVDVKAKAVDLVGCKVVGNYKDKYGKLIAGEGHILAKQDVDELIKNHKTIKVIPTEIKYEPVIAGVETAPAMGHENWFSNLGHRDLNRQLARGATFGQTDKLEDSRARLMAGKAPSIGRGFKLNKTNKDLSNSFANSLANMFKK